MNDAQEERMCRTCMCKDAQLHDISEPINLEEPLSMRIYEMLAATVPELLIQQEDRLPQWICLVCRDKLNASYNFQHMCIKSDKQLRVLLGEETKETIANCQQDPLEEIKIELYEEEQANNSNEQLPVALKVEQIEQSTNDETNAEFIELAVCDTVWSDSAGSETLIDQESTATTRRTKRKLKESKSTAKQIPRASNMHNETGVDEIEKPNDRNRRNGHFPCAQCHKVFDRPYRLRRHIAVHSEARPYQCDLCKYRFSRKSLLASHQTTVHKISDGSTKNSGASTPPDGYKCVVCPRRFAKRESLAAHMQVHPKRNGAELYQCEQCPKSFTKFTLLNKHVLTHGDQQFPCELCDKSFALKAHLIEHVNKHKGLKPYVCTYCDKAFQQHSTLKEHIRVHTNDKPYLCSQCGKAFKNSSNMQQHLLRHTGERRYQCPECPSRFVCQSDRIKHMSMHMEVKPHVCDVCGASFGRSYTLKKHKHIHSGERPHKCDECNMTFVFIDHLRRHQRTHTGEKPYKCKFCDRAYSESGDLNKHLRTHIGEKTYQCTQCLEAFKYLAELRAHQTQHYRAQQANEEVATTTIPIESEKITETTTETETAIPAQC